MFIASPALSRVLVYPRTEFFTELWLLDANHMAEDYPYNVTRGENYTVYLGISNRLGHCAYYVVQVKFRNQTQPAPTSFGPIENRTPSSLPSLFNITAFVADEQILEKPLTFSFDYHYDESLEQVAVSGLRLNDVALDMSDCTIVWDAETDAFKGYLFFELWLYDEGMSRFQYHGRFVSLGFNMTVSE
ncbi:MAG: DUF1616 domain-containing protein [Candidatus Bathyarchaeia archaeon]